MTRSGAGPSVAASAAGPASAGGGAWRPEGGGYDGLVSGYTWTETARQLPARRA